MRTVVVMLLLVGFPAFSPAQGVVPRTAWGDPDLQGVWDYRTITPLERPDALAGKGTLTAEDASAFEQAFALGVAD